MDDMSREWESDWLRAQSRERVVSILGVDMDPWAPGWLRDGDPGWMQAGAMRQGVGWSEGCWVVVMWGWRAAWCGVQGGRR